MCRVSQRWSSRAEEGTEVSKEEWPLLQPVDVCGHALHTLLRLDHVEQGRRIWRLDTHVASLQLSALDLSPL